MDKMIAKFIKTFEGCKCTDGVYDLSKRYVFSYNKLVNDDRMKATTMHNIWIKELKNYDGKEVVVINDIEAELNGYGIARNWCEEIN